jgi:hypothetical protein
VPEISDERLMDLLAKERELASYDQDVREARRMLAAYSGDPIPEAPSDTDRLREVMGDVRDLLGLLLGPAPAGVDPDRVPGIPLSCARAAHRLLDNAVRLFDRPGSVGLDPRGD